MSTLGENMGPVSLQFGSSKYLTGYDGVGIRKRNLSKNYARIVFFFKNSDMPSHSRCVVQGRAWQTHYLTLKSAKPGLLSHFCPCPSLPHHTIYTFFAFYVCILYILSQVGENTVSGLREPGSIQHTWFSFIAPLFMVIVIVSMFCHQKNSASSDVYCTQTIVMSRKHHQRKDLL